MGKLVARNRGRVALATVAALLAALLLPLLVSSDSDDPGAPLLTPLAAAAEKSPAFPGARVTIDGRRVSQITLVLPFEIFGPGTTMEMTMGYSDYGVTPSIELPRSDEVFDGTRIGIEGAKALSG